MVAEISTSHTADSLAEALRGKRGLVLLRSMLFDSPQARYSFVAAWPMLELRSFGSRCEIRSGASRQTLFGNPWTVLESLLARYELSDEPDLPLPLGGCFGYWGYDLKNFVEPKLSRRAPNDLELPDCRLGFYPSLVAFDHQLGKTWIIATGLRADGSRSAESAQLQHRRWAEVLNGTTRPRESATAGVEQAVFCPPRTGEDCAPYQRPDIEDFELSIPSVAARIGPKAAVPRPERENPLAAGGTPAPPSLISSASRDDFIRSVHRAQAYIRSGDIYQVNLSHRLSAPWAHSGWDFFQRLAAVSPAPFSACLECGDFTLASSSPELFLRLSGNHITTQPIKGTRPRSTDPTRDAQLAYELQTSAKELAELIMITDLLRNDLGRFCEFGTVHVSALARLERFSHVQHLVSSIEGRLKPGQTHGSALAACFPGGSVTGAPKFRAMAIIDELEPTARGPYTGALGYLGFNHESQLSIIIRSAIVRAGMAYFQVGAGIVADSDPAAEYEETLAKAAGFSAALHWSPKLKALHARSS